MGIRFQATKGDPSSQRAHLALVHAAIDVDIEWNDDGVVSLHTADEMLTNSLEVMDWAIDQMENPDWTDWDLDQMDDSITLIELADGPFWGYLQHAGEQTDHDQIQECIVLASGFLAQLEALLSDQKYLLDNKPLLCDFAVLPLVHYFIEFASQEWEALDFPKLKAWYKTLFATQECQEVFSCR